MSGVAKAEGRSTGGHAKVGLRAKTIFMERQDAICLAVRIVASGVGLPGF